MKGDGEGGGIWVTGKKIKGMRQNIQQHFFSSYIENNGYEYLYHWTKETSKRQDKAGSIQLNVDYKN